jgi:hypothetical protein
MIPNKNILCILVIIVSLILIFEVEIRNIGTLEEDYMESLELLSISKLRISVFGFLFPIMFALILGKLDSLFLQNRLFYLLVFCFIYGVLVFFIRNNPFSGFGGDTLVYIALFTGLSLGVLLPNIQTKIAAGLTLLSAIPTFLATILLFSLPGADFLTSFGRTTHPSAFILLGLPLSLVAPSMIYTVLLRNVKWIAISWISAGVLLVVTISILQTRSQAIAVILSIIIAIVTSLSTSSYFDNRLKKGKTSKIVAIFISTLIIFVIATLYFSKVNFILFLIRMLNAFEFQYDGGIAPRLEEVPLVYGSMDFFGHVFGMGFNPVSPLIDWRGNPYNNTHIGILNIWWRFGFPVFLWVLYLFAGLLLKYYESLKYICIRSLWNKVNNETFATIICAPGVITIFIISCMSGGWGISTMISLGILWGVHGIIANKSNDFFIEYK